MAGYIVQKYLRAETEKNSMGTKTFKFMISTFMNRKYMQYITVHFQ